MLVSRQAEGTLEALLARSRIFCMASGDLGGARKYYFYSRDAAGAEPAWYMVEVTAAASSKRLTVVFKTDACGDEAWRADVYMAMFKACIGDALVAPPTLTEEDGASSAALALA